MDVYIATTEPVTGYGLRAMCAELEHVVIGSAADAATLRNDTVRLRPQLVISDVPVLDPDAPDVVRALSTGDASVLLYSDSPVTAMLAGLLRAGARGVIGRSVTPDGLRAAVDRVRAGEPVLDAELQARLTTQLLDDVDRVSLSRRERDVLRLVVEGQPTARIATTLHMSETTVKTHLKRSSGKLKTRGRAATAAQAVRDGLL